MAALSTATASEINPLKEIHVGPNVVRSRITWGSLSATVSDVLLLARIPNGATVYDWTLWGGASGATSPTSGTYKVGVRGTVVDAISGATLTEDSLFGLASITGSGVVRGGISTFNLTVSSSIIVGGRPGNLFPFKVSLSDDAANQFIWISAVVNEISATGTTSLNFMCWYLVGE